MPNIDYGSTGRWPRRTTTLLAAAVAVQAACWVVVLGLRATMNVTVPQYLFGIRIPHPVSAGLVLFVLLGVPVSAAAAIVCAISLVVRGRERPERDTLNWHEYIEQVSGVALGKPVFRGTRLTVEFVLERLSQGARPEDLVRSHPPLTGQLIRAALAYAGAAQPGDERPTAAPK